MSQKIRIKLKSYDHNLVDKSAEKIVKTVKTTGAVVTGPIPLPTHKKIFTVLRSPHVNKKSREQFQLSSYKRLLDIYSSSSKTIDALMKLELPSGVEVEIKVQLSKIHNSEFIILNLNNMSGAFRKGKTVKIHSGLKYFNPVFLSNKQLIIIKGLRFTIRKSKIVNRKLECLG